MTLFYVLCQGPGLYTQTGFPASIFPLNTLFLVRNVAFDAHGIDDVLTAMAPVSPSIPLLIWPPGTFLLAKALGSIRGMFLLQFVVQAARSGFGLPAFPSRPLPSGALVVGLFAAGHLTASTTWGPDTLAQPLILLALGVWAAGGGSVARPRWWIPLGALARS